MEAGHAVGASGGIVNHIDRAGERGRTKVHGRRASHHLDPLDVVQADRLDLRNERAAGGYAIDQQQQIVHLADAEQARDRSGRARISAGRDADTTQQRQGGTQIVRAAGAYLVAGDHADRTGHFHDRLAEARGRHLDRGLKRRRIL